MLEARELDGTRYPTSTLNMLLSDLKRYMVKANPSTPNFLDDKDTCFSGLRGTRDTVAIGNYVNMESAALLGMQL